MLGQVFPSRMLTTQQQMRARRLMETFADIAAGAYTCTIASFHCTLSDFLFLASFHSAPP
jgi:hypothetical protein